MKRMDIRCCCVPGKLLGSVPVPDNTNFGQTVRFVVMKPAGKFDWRGPQTVKFSNDLNSVVLDVARVGMYDEYGGQYIEVALKSMGTPIEVLRRIPGFIAAEPPLLSDLATKDSP